MCNIFPLRGTNNEVLGAISANLDITERKYAEQQIEDQKAALERANLRLEKLAVTDGLTELWNQRRFQEELEAVYTSHRESGRQMSLLLLDVDNFKQYNDNYGHPAGDLVLKMFAEQLQAIADEGQSVSRYGGEEFTIILPDCDAVEALAVGERFRAGIASANWPLSLVTTSIGIATSGASGDSPALLIKEADDALYVSKQNGRNMVTHFAAVTGKRVAAA